MKPGIVTGFLILALSLSFCGKTIDRDYPQRIYHDVTDTELTNQEPLFAAAREGIPEYVESVAYLDSKGDTIIPFGKWGYFGTDILIHYAIVIEMNQDSITGGIVAIDRDQHILFDVVLFDNAPDEYHEGLVRVRRNGKIGFADGAGQIVIPCDYDFAGWFENGVARVTFDATEYLDGDEHARIESTEWFLIEKTGSRISNN